MSQQGLRYNQGKPRFDLLPRYAMSALARIMTRGAEKYAERNWEKGMSWGWVLASLKRHLDAYERGEDFEPESGELHMGHVMANAAFLTEYYKIYPEGDDRPHLYLQPKKIGLDIDDVLAAFCTHWTDRFGGELPLFWSFDSQMAEKFAEVANDKEFWVTMPVNIKPEDLPFEPACYITSRGIPQEWTQEWLDRNGFPSVPLYTVGLEMSKVDVALDAGIDYFVDDKYDNFVELNNAGICTFLFDRPHNRKYDVGFKRIHNLYDLV